MPAKNEASKESRPRKRRHDVAYKRHRSSKVLEANGETVNQGIWTDLETVALLVCLEVTEDICEDLTGCAKLYDMCTDSTQLILSKKSLNQIKAKHEHMLRSCK